MSDISGGVFAKLWERLKHHIPLTDENIEKMKRDKSAELTLKGMDEKHERRKRIGSSG